MASADVWNAVGTFLAAGAAVGAWIAAGKSSSAATSLTRIEERRLHVEFTPKLEATCTAGVGNTALLALKLVGPDGIDLLAEAVVTVRDDKPRAPGPHFTPEQQDEFVRQVWGPYQFRPGIDGANGDGRSIQPFELVKDETKLLSMEKTLPPREWAGDWDEEYAGQPVRLAIRCTAEGFDPWTIRLEVPVTTRAS